MREGDCREGNPILRSLARHPVLLLGVKAVFVVGSDLAILKANASGGRRSAVIAAVLIVAVQGLAATHNALGLRHTR